MVTNNMDLDNKKFLKQTSSDVIPEEEAMEFHKIMQRYIPIVAIYIMIILIMIFFISPLSKVGTVSITGNDAVYDQMIINESNIHGGDSIIETYQKLEDIEKNITANLPQVAETNASIVDINNIQINVKEFNTVAYIAQDGSYLRVLENGVVLDDVYSVSIGNQPVLSKFEESEALNAMIEQLGELDAPILNLISEIELVENRDNPLFIRVYMNNGNRILASIPTFSEKIPYYPQMVKAVEGKKGIFDMEAGVYFIPFVDGESEESGIDEDGRESIEEFNS